MSVCLSVCLCVSLCSKLIEIASMTSAACQRQLHCYTSLFTPGTGTAAGRQATVATYLVRTWYLATTYCTYYVRLSRRLPTVCHPTSAAQAARKANHKNINNNKKASGYLFILSYLLIVVLKYVCSFLHKLVLMNDVITLKRESNAYVRWLVLQQPAIAFRSL